MAAMPSGTYLAVTCSGPFEALPWRISCIYDWYRALLSSAEALRHMQHSSAAAVACLREAGATGCSDVTGFGLIGNLAEMTRASQVLSWGQEASTV